MRIDVFTIFPQMVEHFVDQSLLGRARREGRLEVRVHDLRSCATDPHRSVDDAPFGGGAGMVLMPEPVFAAVEAVDPPRPLLYLSPAGRRFDQSVARELAALDGFSLLCGRYEGVDERIREHLCDGELSIGDFVLSGARWRRWWSSRRWPASSRVMGNVARRGRVVQRRLLSPPLHPTGRLPGLDGARVLRSGDHGRIARWRGPRRCAARSTAGRT